MTLSARASETPRRKADLLAMAVLGLATFPVVGSALALLLQVPRRTAQIGVLIIWIAVLLFGVIAFCGQRLVHFATMRTVRQSAIISAAVTGPLVVAAPSSNPHPSPYAVFAGFATALRLAIFLYMIGQMFQPADRFAGPTVRTPDSFSTVFLVVLFWMAATAYYRGPEPRDIYMAFRGSTTQAGAAAAILAAVALATLDGWRRAVGVTLALYLCFVATSRVGLILLTGLSGVVLAACSAGRTHRLCIDFRRLALLIVCAVAVVLPARWSAYYPYASSRPEPVGSRVMHACYRIGNVVTEGCTSRGKAGAHVLYLDAPLTDWEAMAQRYSRFARLFRRGQRLQGLSAGELWQLEVEGKAETRWALLTQSALAVTARPFGHWPKPFDEATRIYCGFPLFCKYPHNLVLEIGYHFGWVPLGIASVGLLAAVVWVFRAVGHPSIAVRVSAIAFLGQLGSSQVSGNLTDHLVALGLGFLLVALEAMLR